MKKIVLLLIVAASIQACIVTQTLNFANCDFNYKGVDKFTANGVNVLGKSSLKDLSAADNMNLSKALITKKLNVDMNMALDVVNKEEGKAVLNAVDWVLVLKNKEVLTGTTAKRLEIPGGKSAVLPLSLSFNLFKVLNGSNMADLWAIVQNPSDPNVITVKLKPSIQVGGVQVKYPGYININY